MSDKFDSNENKAEKKVSRVIKWLERCRVACHSGSYESALMDIECARVDFDAARDHVWAAAANKLGNVRHTNLSLFRVCFTACILLMCAAAPVSVSEGKKIERLHLEWVGPDEKALLATLRSRLSTANTTDFTDVFEEDSQEYAVSVPNERKQKAAVQQDVPAKVEKVDKLKDEVQILSLVKTGERALRDGQSVVKVER